VDDEGVRESTGLRHPVGGQRDDRRALEHADGGRGRGKDEREPGRDDGEEPGGRREFEVESEHDDPEGDPEHEPGEKRPEERDQAEPCASQPYDSLHQVANRRLHPCRGDEREAGNRTQREPERAFAVDPEDDDYGQQRQRERDREAAGGAHPGDLRQPRQRHEQKQEEREHVEEPLDDDRPRRLGSRLSAERVERHDAGGIPGTKGKNAVEELADEQGFRGRPHRRPRAPSEEVSPTQRPHEEGEREHGERRDERPVVALAQGVAQLAEIDVPHGEVGEPDRDDGRKQGRTEAHEPPPPEQLHPDRSRATQASS
jgi:hypothetical protein